MAPYSDYVHYIAAVAIALTATFNYVGLKWGSLVQNLTTAAKYGGLLFIILLAFAIGLPKTGGHYTPAVPEGSFHIAAFGLALVSVLRSAHPSNAQSTDTSANPNAAMW